MAQSILTNKDLKKYGKRAKVGMCVEMQVSTLINWITELKPRKILEIGCGSGFYADFVLKNIYDDLDVEIITCDITKGVLNKNSCIEFIQCDGSHLPFNNGYFDCVYSMDVIEHINNDMDFVNENIRVLKKGGDLIIGTPNKNRLSLKLLKLIGREVKYPYCLGKDPVYGDVIHLREYTEEEILKLISTTNYSSNLYLQESKQLCFGILGLIELAHYPYFLEKFCQFSMVRFRKSLERT